jgi:hypothetical protein
MQEIDWNGETITEPGVYRNIPIDTYHEKADLFDGPSVSKSSLKWLFPFRGGSPKQFWARWKHNPDHIEQESGKALDFGKAAHALILGDEVFSERFIVRPSEYVNDKGDTKPWSMNANACKAWVEAIGDSKTIVSPEDIEMIRKMALDAASHPMVQSGILNGAMERTMCWKCPETGIWVKARPDCIPVSDGLYADLKTVSKLDEGFLTRQIFEADYYLQGGMIKMICDEQEMPFDEFWLVYCLKSEVADTAPVKMSEFAIQRGEKVIRAGLRMIRDCMDAGEWPGAMPFHDGNVAIHLKDWDIKTIDQFLEAEAADRTAETSRQMENAA